MTCDCSPACRQAADVVAGLEREGLRGVRLVAILPAGTEPTEEQVLRWGDLVLVESPGRNLVLRAP